MSALAVSCMSQGSCDTVFSTIMVVIGGLSVLAILVWVAVAWFLDEIMPRLRAAARGRYETNPVLFFVFNLWFWVQRARGRMEKDASGVYKR